MKGFVSVLKEKDGEFSLDEDLGIKVLEIFKLIQ
jgi:hypothetical protein